jgi:response regulator RpfG family c-di-GMP phosphodiesterase
VQTHPETRTLFTSGYTENIIAHHGVLDHGIEFLSKPYTLEQLTRRVREILDQAPRGPGSAL